jgi:hypothetical protein
VDHKLLELHTENTEGVIDLDIEEIEPDPCLRALPPETRLLVHFFWPTIREHLTLKPKRHRAATRGRPREELITEAFNLWPNFTNTQICRKLGVSPEGQKALIESIRGRRRKLPPEVQVAMLRARRDKLSSGKNRA